MARFFEDWSDYQLGDDPTVDPPAGGEDPRWELLTTSGAPFAFEIVEDGGVRFLRATQPDSNGGGNDSRETLAFVPAGSVEDASIFARYRSRWASGNPQHLDSWYRVDGNGDIGDAYHARHNVHLLRRVVAGGTTTLADETSSQPTAQETWYNHRTLIETDGNGDPYIEAKLWTGAVGDEPGTTIWEHTDTDAAALTDPGKVGPGWQRTGNDANLIEHDIQYLGIGWGGDPAPTEPVVAADKHSLDGAVAGSVGAVAGTASVTSEAHTLDGAVTGLAGVVAGTASQTDTVVTGSIDFSSGGSNTAARAFVPAALVANVPLTMVAWGAFATLPSDDRGIANVARTEDNPDHHTLRVDGGGAKIYSVDGTGAAASVTTSAARAAVDAWTHYCGRFAAVDSRSVLQDGGGKADNTTSRTTLDSAIAMIGNHINVANGGTPRNFPGRLAHIGFYSTDLSDAQIAELAGGASPLDVAPESLEAYYPGTVFTDGEGTWLEDVVGDNHMELLGGAVWDEDQPTVDAPSAPTLEAPAGLAATPSPGALDWSWDAVSGATGYQLELTGLHSALAALQWETVSRPASAGDAGRSIAYDPNSNTLVATGRFADHVMVSEDGGATWSLHSVPDQEWMSIVWADSLGLFVSVSATGGGQRAMTSPNGKIWTQHNTPESNPWRNLAWSPALELLVASADSGTSRIMTSPDGENWTARTVPVQNRWRELQWVPWLDEFVALSRHGSAGDSTKQIMTSANGEDWTAHTTPSYSDWFTMAVGPDLLVVAAALDDGDGDQVMTSADGRNWAVQAGGIANVWISSVYCEGTGLYVVLPHDQTSGGGVGNQAMTSPDGVDWTSRGLPADGSWYGAIWVPELKRLIATATMTQGDEDTDSIIISPPLSAALTVDVDNELEYLQDELEPGSEYDGRVRAYDGGGNGDWSSTVQGTAGGLGDHDLDGAVTGAVGAVAGTATVNGRSHALDGAVVGSVGTVSGAISLTGKDHGLAGAVTGTVGTVAGTAIVLGEGHVLDGAVTGTVGTVAGTATVNGKDHGLAGAITGRVGAVSGAVTVNGKDHLLSGSVLGLLGAVSGSAQQVEAERHVLAGVVTGSVGVVLGALIQVDGSTSAALRLSSRRGARSLSLARSSLSISVGRTGTRRLD